jgi:RpiR family carbohydrate utilization transcriptional regulator
MKKNNIFSRHSSPLALRRGIFLLKRLMISPINEIVSIDERPLLMNMLEKIQSRWNTLANLNAKWRKSSLLPPRRPFIQASPPWRWKPASANRPVNRFCRSLETRGFPDFKLHLAQSLAHGTLYVNRNVDEDDSVESYTGKYLNRPWPV